MEAYYSASASQDYSSYEYELTDNAMINTISSSLISSSSHSASPRTASPPASPGHKPRLPPLAVAVPYWSDGPNGQGSITSEEYQNGCCCTRCFMRWRAGLYYMWRSWRLYVVPLAFLYPIILEYFVVLNVYNADLLNNFDIIDEYEYAMMDIAVFLVMLVSMWILHVEPAFLEFLGVVAAFAAHYSWAFHSPFTEWRIGTKSENDIRHRTEYYDTHVLVFAIYLSLFLRRFPLPSHILRPSDIMRDEEETLQASSMALGSNYVLTQSRSHARAAGMSSRQRAAARARVEHDMTDRLRRRRVVAARSRNAVADVPDATAAMLIRAAHRLDGGTNDHVDVAQSKALVLARMGVGSLPSPFIAMYNTALYNTLLSSYLAYMAQVIMGADVSLLEIALARVAASYADVLLLSRGTSWIAATKAPQSAKLQRQAEAKAEARRSQIREQSHVPLPDKDAMVTPSRKSAEYRKAVADGPGFDKWAAFFRDDVLEHAFFDALYTALLRTALAVFPTSAYELIKTETRRMFALDVFMQRDSDPSALRRVEQRDPALAQAPHLHSPILDALVPSSLEKQLQVASPSRSHMAGIGSPSVARARSAHHAIDGPGAGAVLVASMSFAGDAYSS
ncbi:uncharacterized protein AMSG_04329 [Thecamonas trahens ATCC 50062]|uniref:Uncharacterized protein n=1 Tax=Thecamonas trahens ATCC 50062 TaxID=461836 RepID=A0A0L0D6Y5_THETB|nr:hypothetical protein AMSG_04329 [Thecamonas trahens ATCC 50062]KNC48099.1 hypothetical protein AMSG_04329 [Thecamonas trahens ATCC 50062]|eukprot:XP_013758675.1 hypothetical protein AMSG_04329 [Thecamonas trahens ATCC 50062]